MRSSLVVRFGQENTARSFCRAPLCQALDNYITEGFLFLRLKHFLPLGWCYILLFEVWKFCRKLNITEPGNRSNCRQPSKPCAWEGGAPKVSSEWFYMIIIVFYDETNEIFVGLRRFCFVFREFHTITWIFIEITMIFIDSGPVRRPTAAIFIGKINENHRYFD